MKYLTNELASIIFEITLLYYEVKREYNFH